jgi:AMMECR1 domain-containing protein
MNNNILFQSLFQHLFQLNNKSSINSNVMNKINNIPPHTFGVFVTVKRSSFTFKARDAGVTIHRSPSQTLNSWPGDIHGCIGYWDPNFQEMTSHDLYNKMLEVGYSAMWSDSRRNYFAPIQTDPYAIIDIQWMSLPIISLNKNREISINQYNPIIDGLIVQTPDGQRATYLPNVFPNQRFNQIKSSLMNKAGISQSSSQDISFYSYKTLSIHKTLIDCMKMPELVRSYMSPFITTFMESAKLNNNNKKIIENNSNNSMNQILLFNKNTQNNKNNKINETNIPYEVGNNKIIYENGEQVRNIGSLETFIRTLLFMNSETMSPYKPANSETMSPYKPANSETMSPYKPAILSNLKLPRMVMKEIKKYMMKYSQNSRQMRQSSAFLLNCLYELFQYWSASISIQGKIVEIMVKIINNIITSIRSGNILEPQFERGEILLAINKIRRNGEIFTIIKDKIDLNFIIQLNMELIHDGISRNFELQTSRDAIFEANWIIQALRYIDPTSLLKELTNQIVNYFCRLIEQDKYQLSEYETNELAVIWEGLSAFSLIEGEGEGEESEKRDTALFQIFLELDKRYSAKWGLYKFKNENMRVDITSHVFSGFFYQLEVGDRLAIQK